MKRQRVSKKNLNPNTRSITSLEALDKYGCLRLGARIYDLRNEPYNMAIRSRLVLTNGGKRISRYSLIRSR